MCGEIFFFSVLFVYCELFLYWMVRDCDVIKFIIYRECDNLFKGSLGYN